jgi:hypothetical protein
LDLTGGWASKSCRTFVELFDCQLQNRDKKIKVKNTPPALQVPTSYGKPALKRGSPIKIAALTIFTAEEESRTDVSVTPWLGTPPPHKAASIISPP